MELGQLLAAPLNVTLTLDELAVALLEQVRPLVELLVTLEESPLESGQLGALGPGLLLGLSLIAFPLLGVGATDVSIVVGVMALAAFLYVEVRASHPMLDLALFRRRAFGFASATGALNGLARGAVLFVLIFFRQGPYGQDPLRAGLMLTPFGAAFMLVGPASGYLSDRLGPRGLTTAGLLISAVGLLGLATITTDTPYWYLAVLMALMGGGSGLFSSPNTNALMSSVAPHQRGSAAGVYWMLNNTGQMLSITIAFPLVLSRIPEDVMFRVFLYGGGMGSAPAALAAFEGGAREAFLVSCAITLGAAVVSALRPARAHAG